MKIRIFLAALFMAAGCFLSPFASAQALAADEPVVLFAAETNAAEEAEPEFYTGCDAGYYPNPATGRCNKIKVCKTGYLYEASTNSCHKITCPFGYKVSAEDGQCHKLVCDEGYILSASSGNCVKAPASIRECGEGMAYSTSSKSCVEAPESGSDSVNAGNGELAEEVLEWLTVAPSASSSGYTTALADIRDPEYAELRELVLAYLAEQESLEDELLREEADSDEKTISCPAGKVMNPATGRCRQAVTVTETATSVTTVTFDPVTGKTTTVKKCVAGYTLNKETNRCNKNSSAGSKTKSCPAGQAINPATGRCKKLVTTTKTSTSVTTTTFDPVTGETRTVKTCIEGYELNPDTNRCNKVKVNNGAAYALDIPDLGTIMNSPKVFVALATVVAAVVLGLGFAVFQLRHEIARLVRKVWKKIRRR